MAAKEQQAVYAVDRKLKEDSTIAYALEILERRLTRRRQGNEQFSSPGYAADYAKLKLAALEHEVFLGLFLDLCVCLRNVKQASHRQARPTDTGVATQH